MADFRPTSAKRVWVGRAFFVEEGEFEIEGERFVREVVRHPGSVAVVPYTGERVVLIRQYRPVLDEWVYEIPAGKRDMDDEGPVAAAERECVEETGYRPGRISLLHRFHNSVGYTDEETHLFLGEELERVGSAPEGWEEMHAEIVEMELADAFHTVAGSEVVDAKTILGLYAVLQRFT